MLLRIENWLETVVKNCQNENEVIDNACAKLDTELVSSATVYRS